FWGGGTEVGHGRDLAFGAGSLWVVSVEDSNQTSGPGLRRVDPRGPSVDHFVKVGSNPVAVAWEDGAIWVASRGGSAMKRVDPAADTVVRWIPLGSPPTALAPDDHAGGVWVAVE